MQWKALTMKKHEIKTELNLSNYAKKSGLKCGTGINTLKFPNRTNLASQNHMVMN